MIDENIISTHFVSYKGRLVEGWLLHTYVQNIYITYSRFFFQLLENVYPNVNVASSLIINVARITYNGNEMKIFQIYWETDWRPARANWRRLVGSRGEVSKIMYPRATEPGYEETAWKNDHMSSSNPINSWTQLFPKPNHWIYIMHLQISLKEVLPFPQCLFRQEKVGKQQTIYVILIQI